MNKFFYIILFSLVLNQCKKKDVYYLNVPDTGEPQNVDIVIKNFTAEGYKEKSLNWSLKADTSYIIYSDYKVEMNGIQMTYHENPKIKSVLTCESATMNRNTNDLILKGNIVIKSSNGRELSTNVLFWDSKKEELSTNLPVKIAYSDGELIKGKGMKANGSLSKIVIFQPVGVHTIKNE